MATRRQLQRALMAVCAGRQRTQDGKSHRRRGGHRHLRSRRCGCRGREAQSAVDGDRIPEGSCGSIARGCGCESTRCRVRTRWPISRRWCRAVRAASCFPRCAAAPMSSCCDHYLTALEVACGIEQGSTKVIVLVTETAEAMFTTGNYAGAPRLAAMSWGAEDLADSLGASQNRNEDGSYAFTFQLARSLCLMGAAVAGVPPSRRFTATSATRRDCANARRKCAATATAACSPSTRRRSMSSMRPSPERGGVGGARRRSSICSPLIPARARSATRAPCSIARISPAPRRCSRSRRADDGHDRPRGAGTQQVHSRRRPHRLGPGMRRADDARRGAHRAGGSIGKLSAFAATSFSGILNATAAEKLSLSSMGAIGALRTRGGERPTRHRALSREPDRTDDRAGTDRLRRRVRAGQPARCRRQSQLRPDQRLRPGGREKGARGHRRGE